MIATNLQKYNNKCFLASDAGKKLMLETHGAEHPMHVPKFFEKARKACFKAKIYTLPSGKNIRVYGYEWMLMDHLINDLSINEKDIIVKAKKVPDVRYISPDDNKTHRYFMDAYIKSKDIGIEVKSEWTFIKEREKNKAKWIAASKICKGGFHVYVFDKDGSILGGGEIENGEITGTRFGPKKSKIIDFKIGDWM